jgi:hypothetical protein
MSHAAGCRLWTGMGVLVMGLALTGISALAAPINVPMKVFSGDTQNIVYVGDYVFDQDGTKISEKWEYRTPKGDKVRIRASVYDSATRRPISYEDTDLLKNTKLQVTVDGDKIRVQMGDLKGNVDTDKTTKLPNGAFITPNFVHVLAQDWDKFVADKVGELSLYIMTRQDTYGMKVVVEQELTVGGVPSQRFSMEPTSFMVRQFAPKAKLIVSKDAPHRVMMFQGNGDLQDPQGNKLDATVVFEWPKP